MLVSNDMAVWAPPGLASRVSVRMRWPPLHSAFAMGRLEVAILLSHLRAVALGQQQGIAGPFAVLEEDVELPLLRATPSSWLQVRPFGASEA